MIPIWKGEAEVFTVSSFSFSKIEVTQIVHTVYYPILYVLGFILRFDYLSLDRFDDSSNFHGKPLVPAALAPKYRISMNLHIYSLRICVATWVYHLNPV